VFWRPERLVETRRFQKSSPPSPDIFERFSEEYSLVSLHLRLGGGAGSLGLTFLRPKFPANREKYRECRRTIPPPTVSPAMAGPQPALYWITSVSQWMVRGAFTLRMHLTTACARWVRKRNPAHADPFAYGFSAAQSSRY
jgi:hypothetical protein